MRHRPIILSLALLLLWCTSCYKANDTPEGKIPPQYDIRIRGYYSEYPVSSGQTTINIKRHDTLQESLVIQCTGGNAAEYPFTCDLTDLPANTSTTLSGLNFRLSFNTSFTIAANAADTGMYTIYLRMYNADLGEKNYPIWLHVIP